MWSFFLQEMFCLKKSKIIFHIENSKIEMYNLSAKLFFFKRIPSWFHVWQSVRFVVGAMKTIYKSKAIEIDINGRSSEVFKSFNIGSVVINPNIYRVTFCLYFSINKC